MVPMTKDSKCRESGTATISVLDRFGRRFFSSLRQRLPLRIWFTQSRHRACASIPKKKADTSAAFRRPEESACSYPGHHLATASTMPPDDAANPRGPSQ